MSLCAPWPRNLSSIISLREKDPSLLACTVLQADTVVTDGPRTSINVEALYARLEARAKAMIALEEQEQAIRPKASSRRDYRRLICCVLRPIHISLNSNLACLSCAPTRSVSVHGWCFCEMSGCGCVMLEHWWQ